MQYDLVSMAVPHVPMTAACIRQRRRNPEVDMMRAASVFPFRSEFDAFLFAPIGEERNGMLLSVLSALARQDVDPWEEAASLARLPGDTATQRLASLIAALPDAASVHRDAGTIAARLIALLPQPASSDVASRKTLLGTSPMRNPRAFVICLILMAFLLAGQCVVAGRQPPAQVDNTHAALSSTAFPQMSKPSFSD